MSQCLYCGHQLSTDGRCGCITQRFQSPAIDLQSYDPIVRDLNKNKEIISNLIRSLELVSTLRGYLLTVNDPALAISKSEFEEIAINIRKSIDLLN